MLEGPAHPLVQDPATKRVMAPSGGSWSARPTSIARRLPTFTNYRISGAAILAGRTPAGVPGLRARCRRWTDGEGHLFEDLAVDGRPDDVTVSGLER